MTRTRDHGQRISGLLFSMAMIIFAITTNAHVVDQPQRLPNIVIIYADDMGFGDLAIQKSGANSGVLTTGG